MNRDRTQKTMATPPSHRSSTPEPPQALRGDMPFGDVDEDRGPLNTQPEASRMKISTNIELTQSGDMIAQWRNGRLNMFKGSELNFEDQCSLAYFILRQNRDQLLTAPRDEHSPCTRQDALEEMMDILSYCAEEGNFPE